MSVKKPTRRGGSLIVNGVTALDRIASLLEVAPAGLTTAAIAAAINRDEPSTRRVLGALRARRLAAPGDDGRWRLTGEAREQAKARRSA